MVVDVSSWSSGTVDISGGHLAYHRTGGNGPQMVLLHGLTDNGLCWSRFASAFTGEFDIIMLDSRGHGASSRIVERVHLDPAQDIAEAIDGLGLNLPVLLGHSVGALAAAAFAARFPAYASKLILEDPPLLPLAEPSAAKERDDRFRKQIAFLQPLSDSELTAMGRESSPSWHEDEFPAWVLGKRQVDPLAMPHYTEPWQSIFAALTLPTLLIYGESQRGGMVTPAIATEALRINPYITAVFVENAGHNIRRENFCGFLAAVRAFLHRGVHHAL